MGFTATPPGSLPTFIVATTVLLVGTVTVKVTMPETIPEVALIVVVPTATPVVLPELSGLAATKVLLLVQATLPVMLAVELSEYVPVAVKVIGAH